MKRNPNSAIHARVFFYAGSAAALLLCSNASATLSSIGPFSGSMSETWESFNDYLTTNFHYLPDPTSIMGGGATISSPRMAVYNPNTAANFGLGSSGSALISDGVHGMGLDNPAQTATITFANPVGDFGAYWGANTPPNPSTVSLAFSDGSLANFTYDHSSGNPGVLEWHGWHSTVGITSVSYSGDYVVVDGLQANPVPEPGMALLGALGVGLALSRRPKR